MRYTARGGEAKLCQKKGLFDYCDVKYEHLPVFELGSMAAHAADFWGFSTYGDGRGLQGMCGWLIVLNFRSQCGRASRYCVMAIAGRSRLEDWRRTSQRLVDWKPG